MTDPEIVERFRSGETCAAIAADLGIPERNVRRAVVGDWYADKAKAKEEKPKRKVTRTITPDTVRAIRADKGRFSAKETAERNGVSVSTVRRIWIGETYREVK